MTTRYRPFPDTMTSWLQRGTSPLELWIAPGCSHGGIVANAGGTSNTVSFRPFVLGARVTLDRMQIEVTNTPTNTSLTRLGLYNGIQSKGIFIPTTLIVDSGDIATIAAALYPVTINVTLEPDTLYFTAFMSNSVATQPQTRSVAAGGMSIGVQTGLTAQVSGFRQTFTYAAFPTSWPQTTYTPVSAPVVFLRAAS